MLLRETATFIAAAQWTLLMFIGTDMLNVHTHHLILVASSFFHYIPVHAASDSIHADPVDHRWRGWRKKSHRRNLQYSPFKAEGIVRT